MLIAISGEEQPIDFQLRLGLQSVSVVSRLENKAVAPNWPVIQKDFKVDEVREVTRNWERRENPPMISSVAPSATQA
jgi:hypothetical protein